MDANNVAATNAAINQPKTRADRSTNPKTMMARSIPAPTALIARGPRDKRWLSVALVAT